MGDAQAGSRAAGRTTGATGPTGAAGTMGVTALSMVLVLVLASAPAMPALGAGRALRPVPPGSGCNLLGTIDTGWNFAFDLPDELAGCETESHDVVIPLGETYVAREIRTRGDFNDACIAELYKLEERLADLGGFDLARERPRVMRREAALLAGRPARRVVITWRDGSTAEPMVSDTIIATAGDPRPPCAAPGVVFSMELVTPVRAYDADKWLFEKILRTARVVPAPH